MSSSPPLMLSPGSRAQVSMARSPGCASAGSPSSSVPLRDGEAFRGGRRPWRPYYLLAAATGNRRIGWQFQEDQLRFQITIEDPDLQGKANRTRGAIVEAEHVGFFDYAGVEAILGSDLKTKNYRPGEWLGFNPNFVYRHRPVKRSVSTARLTEALAAMTGRVDHFADKAGYDTG